MNRAFRASILKELSQHKWSIIGYSLASLFFLTLYISIYPSFQHETAKFDEILRSYPKAVLQAFNIEQLRLSTLEGYISAEHFSFVWPLMAIFLAISSGGVMFAGEIERGTMAVLLSQPLGRTRIFISKYSSGILALLVFVGLSTWPAIPLAASHDLAVHSANISKVALLSFCFAWTIYSLSVLVSARVSEKSKVYLTLGSLLIAMYVANIVSGLVSSLHRLQYVSFFHYYTPDKALVQGQLSMLALGIFLAVPLISSLAAYVIFTRRDISV